MEKLNIIDEISRFLNKNINQIGKEIGKRDGTSLYNIQTGRNKMSRNLAAKLKEAYPQLNELYLLTGEGSIELQPKESPVNDVLLKRVELLERLAGSQDDRINYQNQRIERLEALFDTKKNLMPQTP